ncbi:MAG: transcriptional regulator [Rhodobacter sp. CACIA14H1]|nr:MAG: transcriptional regulator [Rhodobacter sp. CACIA14H1]
MDRLDCDRLFVAVMETGSLAGAAARLGLSSGQASKLLARLESDLGVRLLNRTTRALSPTEVGQAYYDRIRAILDDLDTLDAQVKDRAATPRGRLRLTAPLTFGTLWLAPALNDFANLYREIELDVSFTDRMVNLVDEGFDAAIRAGRVTDSSLIARKLCDMRTIPVASDGYLHIHGTPAHPADLSRHHCIIDTNFRDPLVWRFRDKGTPLTQPVTGRLRYSNAEACLGAAEMGLGIAHVPDFVAGPSLAAGRVRALLCDFGDEAGGIYAMYPPGKHLAAKVRHLVDYLATRFKGADWSVPPQ